MVGVTTAIKQKCNPMAFVHMVSWKNGSLTKQSFNQIWIGFQVNNVKWFIGAEFWRSDGTLGYNGRIFYPHNQRKPLAVINMTKDSIFRCVFPGPVLNNSAKVLANESLSCFSIHILYYTTKRTLQKGPRCGEPATASFELLDRLSDLLLEQCSPADFIPEPISDEILQILDRQPDYTL